MIRIAESRADVDVLIDLMKGTHRPPRSSRIAAIFPIVMFLGSTIVILFRQHGLAAFAFTAVLLSFAAAFINEIITTFTIDANGFERRSIFGRWRIAPHEVHTIDLKFEPAAVLIFETVDGQKRASAIAGSAMQALAALYPPPGGRS